jgi:tetratricopeptide (TPR) repeat protein
MKESTYDIELIEKFLGGKMTEEETKIFNQKRNQDQTFNALLKDMDLLVAGIKQSAAQTSQEEKLERLKFFAEITGMEERAAEEDNASGPEAKVVPLYRKPWVLSAAASIALLITVGLYFMRDQTPVNERLYIAYFEPFDSPGDGMTRGSDEITLKGKAYDAYDNGRYSEAIPLFGQILKTSDDPIIHLCLGNAQMKVGNLTEAGQTFNYLLANHTDLVTQAKWYLALTYLKENKMERAKATLWEISKSSTYGEKAQKLLKELD